MARNDGVDRTTVRNVNLTEGEISDAQHHNEREKESYVNSDIVLERVVMNVHFKKAEAGYAETFQQMEQNGIISTRGLKDGAAHYGELIFDVNSAYFFNHGGYEYAKHFYAEAYKSAIKIVGGEQYILSAVMHADERNSAMSEALGHDVYHYHLHVVYVPVVEKQILWSKRCKDEKLHGTVRETIMQVSSSKKWQSSPVVDDAGKMMLTKAGKPVLRKSYCVLQDDYFNHMQEAGYSDIERGERGSSEEHLTVVQFKVEQEQKRLAELEAEKARKAAEIAQLEAEKEQAAVDAQAAQDKLKQLAPRTAKLDAFMEKIEQDPDKALPEAGLLESARSYRENKVFPFYRRMVKTMVDLYHRCLKLTDKCQRMEDSHKQEVASLKWKLRASEQRAEMLEDKVQRHDKLVKTLGKEQVVSILAATESKGKRCERKMAF